MLCVRMKSTHRPHGRAATDPKRRCSQGTQRRIRQLQRFVRRIRVSALRFLQIAGQQASKMSKESSAAVRPEFASDMVGAPDRIRNRASGLCATP